MNLSRAQTAENSVVIAPHVARPQFGLACAVFSAILSGFSNSFYAAAARSFTPLPYSLVATFLGGLALLIVARVRGPLPPLSALVEERKPLLRLLVLRGVAMTIIFASAIQFTAAAKMIVLTKMEPYLVLLWSWILSKESIQREEIVLLAVHIAGAVLVSVGSGPISLGFSEGGDLLILLALLISGYTYVDAKYASQRIGAVTTSAITNLGAAAIFLPLTLIFAPPITISALSWKDILLSTTLFQLIGLPLWLTSLAHVKGWQVSALRALSPIIGIPFAAYYLHEHLDTLQIFGAAIVLVTCALIGRVTLKTK